MFPSSMLERVYVKGSLKNVTGGVEMALKNTIDYATLVGVGPVIVDGQSYEAASIRMAVGEQEWRGDQVTYSAPVSARMFVPIRLVLEGGPLAAGEHQIVITINTREVGRLKFEVKDNLAE